MAMAIKSIPNILRKVELANNGNAIGTILPEPPCSWVSLKNRIPSIISKPMKKIIKAPANAKEETSIPKMPRIVAPKNKKANMMIAAEPVARL